MKRRSLVNTGDISPESSLLAVLHYAKLFSLLLCDFSTSVALRGNKCGFRKIQDNMSTETCRSQRTSHDLATQNTWYFEHCRAYLHSCSACNDINNNICGLLTAAITIDKSRIAQLLVNSKQNYNRGHILLIASLTECKTRTGYVCSPTMYIPVP